MSNLLVCARQHRHAAWGANYTSSAVLTVPRPSISLHSIQNTDQAACIVQQQVALASPGRSRQQAIMQLHASRHARLSASSRSLQHRGAWTGAPRPVLPARQRCTSANSGSNGSSPSAPSPAETARTIMHLCNEGTLSTITASGAPLGTPIAYTLDANSGQPVMHVAAGSLESQNLERQPSCSLLVQPNAYPARRVAAVAMQGSARPVEGEASEPGMSSYALELDSCLYFGGLDAVSSHDVALV